MANGSCKLDWQKYDWRKFEEICFEYVKTVYSANFYKTELTRAQKDQGRDIVIKAKYKNFEAWGECKNHKRNLDLSIIGKNIVLALSHQINKAIFFSVTPITLNTKTEILIVAQQNGFDVLFLDGELLDEAILSCRKVTYKYFREDYEKYIAKNESDIWVDVFLSEYPFAEDAKNNTKVQYRLHNGFRIYLHIFIKNMRKSYISKIRISLKDFNNADMIFYDTVYSSNNKLPEFSDLMHTFCGLVFSPKKSIILPKVEIDCILNDESHIRKIVTVGEVDASYIWKAPYINTSSENFYRTTAKILKEIIPQNYVRVFYIYGNSGSGKSRLMNEMENKAYENSYKVIHIDFREKTNVIAIQDFLMSLLGLPSSKNKIVISLSEFTDIYKFKINEYYLQIIYNFLFQEHKNVKYDQLTSAIIEIITKNSGGTPILCGLDNIQELSREFQILFWNLLEHCRQISVPICFVLSHNIERNPHIKHVLAEYLVTTGNDKEDYIYKYNCGALLMKDAIVLMQQLLCLSEESEKCIEQVLMKNGTLPMDILLLAKGLSQEEKLFYRIGAHNYIANPHLLVEKANLLSASTEHLIKNRLINMEHFLGDLVEYQDLFSLICHFDGNLPIELYEKCNFDPQILYESNNNLITKINYRENIITFFHEKFYNYFSNGKIYLSRKILEIICSCYVIYNNENIISTYHYVKTLIALKKKSDAIRFGNIALEKYYKEHQCFYVSSLCNALLKIIDPIAEPVQYFKILFLQADVWLENINISEAEKLFERAYEIIDEKFTFFTPEDTTLFFHRYINQKLHTLQYDKAIDILKKFETLGVVTQNTSLIVNDRYCVALYSLGIESEALEKINTVIECAEHRKDYTWLSIAYSDKAFTYFYNSRSVDKVVINFKKAISYYEISGKKDSVSRIIEIFAQSTIVNILENNIMEATANIQKAIDAAEKNVQGYLLIPSFNLYVFLLMMQKNIEKAIYILKRSLYYANISSNEKALISIYNNLGNIYVEKQLHSQALVYYKMGFEVLKNMCAPTNSLRYRGLICNSIKISNFLGDYNFMQEILKDYSFEGIKSLTQSYQNCITSNILISKNYSILNQNSLDYLYY